MNNIYETHKMKDPRLPFIFHSLLIKEDTRSPVHNWHENIEIICVMEGSGFFTCDGTRMSLKKGDVAVINPNALHGLGTENEKMRYYCLIIDRSFFIYNHFDSNEYTFDRLINDDNLYQLIEEFGEYWLEAKVSPIRIQKLRLIAFEIAVLLCEEYAKTNTAPKTEPRLMSCIKQAIGYIRAEYHRDLSLDEVSQFVGISKYYFAREFRHITGYSFVSYLNILRCEKAREMLLVEDMSIVEVSEHCGFVNRSYFTRTFLGYVGSTPSDYRKNNKKPNK